MAQQVFSEDIQVGVVDRMIAAIISVLQSGQSPSLKLAIAPL
jgi:hypothetical protein